MSITSLKTDVLIVGAGPAGLTAGDLRGPGRQEGPRPRRPRRVAPGDPVHASRITRAFPRSTAASCSGIFRKQAVSFGAEVVAGDAIAFALEGSPKYVTTKEAVIEAGAVVLATGRPMPKERLIAGEEQAHRAGRELLRHVRRSALPRGDGGRGRPFRGSPGGRPRPPGHGHQGLVGARQGGRGGGFSRRPGTSKAGA